jgi:AcrR family transcriptional regulator
MTQPPARLRGRPRDPAIDASILETAAQLFAAQGYAATTADEIAQAAGVGKQSIYRRWPSKAELALAALRTLASREIPTDRGLMQFLIDTGRALQRTGHILRALMAEGQSDAKLLALLKSELVLPRREHLAVVLRGLGEAETEWAIAAIFGAVWYRLLLDEPLDEAFARGIAGLFPPSVR